MCFGGGKSKQAPPPAQPTEFRYGPADNSNGQRQVAAIDNTPSAASYGSELGATGNLSGSPTSNGAQ